MSDYQGSKKSSSAPAQKSTAKPQSKIQSKTPEQKAVLCPNCSASVPEEAVFCPECGFNLNAPVFCPNCGTETTPDADICQACGAWLLDGKCMFCYAELDPNADFCADCGNPKGGITCPHCGNHSIFDFCTKCGKPLTEGAAIAMELVKNDPSAKKLLESIQAAAEIEAELAELDTFISNILASGPSSDDGNNSSFNDSPAPPVKKSLFSDSQLSAILKTAENKDAVAARQAEAAKKAEEFRRKQEADQKRMQDADAEKAAVVARKKAEERRKELELQRAKAKAEAQEALKELQNKTFLNQQESRRFFNAIKTLGIAPDGWLCNAYGTLHDSGPNECANPSGGGRWVYKGHVA